MCRSLKSQKNHHKSDFWILKSFKVINIGTAAKLISSGGYDK